jgi:hypothetical protein
MLFSVVSGLFGVENKGNIGAQMNQLGWAGFAADRRTVHSIAYRYAVQLNLPHRFNNEE